MPESMGCPKALEVSRFDEVRRSFANLSSGCSQKLSRVRTAVCMSVSFFGPLNGFAFPLQTWGILKKKDNPPTCLMLRTVLLWIRTGPAGLA